MTTGAGLGWSYGFPLSLEGAAPSLFNLNAQSPLWHFELHDYLGAARAENAAAQSSQGEAKPADDPELQMARPKPPPVKVIRMPDKFPEQPWKKKKIEG